MPPADAGTSVHAISAGPAELLLWLPVRRQVNTKPSQFAKCCEIRNVGGDPKTSPFNPQAPIHQPGERRAGEMWLSFQGWYFSRITSGEAAALPATAGSRPAWARAPQTRSDTPEPHAHPGSVRAESTSPAAGWRLGRHPQLFLISLTQNK